VGFCGAPISFSFASKVNLLASRTPASRGCCVRG